MAARRPKQQQQRESNEEAANANLAAQTADDNLVAHEILKDLWPEPEPVSEYMSLRIKRPVHKLRHGTSPSLVESGGGQQIFFRRLPYDHYVVVPGGIEIPIGNVSSAIPMNAEITKKLLRESRLEEREKHLKEKMALAPEPKAPSKKSRVTTASPRKRAGVQEIPPDEDEELDTDEETPEAETPEASEDEDGIDV